MKTILLISLLTFLSISLYAQPGTLDSAFGNNGKFHYDSAKINLDCFAIQRDGKFLVGGYNRGRQNPCVMRFNNDGTLDVSFGRRGIVLFEGYLGLHYVGNVIKIAVDKHDRVVICASFHPGSKGFSDVGLIRLNPDGTLDTMFNKTGYSSLSLGYYHEEIDMIVQADNNILVSGIVRNKTGNTQFHFLSRSQINGKPDTTFGYRGVVRINSYSIYNIRLLQQPDGKILFGGNNYAPYSFQLERYNINGSVDSSFGISGKTTKRFSEFYYNKLGNLGLQSDGNIIITGALDSKLFVSRFGSDGVYDSTFNVGVGYYRHAPESMGTSLGQTIFITKDNKINVTGIIYWDIYSCSRQYTCENALVVSQYTKNGVPDSAFGVNGIAKADFSTEFENGNTGTNSGRGVIQKDGKIVVSGEFTNDVFAMARFDMKKEKMVALNYKVNSALAIESDKPSVTIYPNPAKDILYIKGLNANEENLLTVLDMHGKAFIRVKTSSYILNIAQLNQGTYFLKMESKDGVVVKKFIKE